MTEIVPVVLNYEPATADVPTAAKNPKFPGLKVTPVAYHLPIGAGVVVDKNSNIRIIASESTVGLQQYEPPYFEYNNRSGASGLTYTLSQVFGIFTERETGFLTTREGGTYNKEGDGTAIKRDTALKTNAFRSEFVFNRGIRVNGIIENTTRPSDIPGDNNDTFYIHPTVASADELTGNFAGKSYTADAIRNAVEINYGESPVPANYIQKIELVDANGNVIDESKIPNTAGTHTQNVKITYINTYTNDENHVITEILPVKLTYVEFPKTTVPGKTPVVDKSNLTDEEKEKIKAEIEENNDFPPGTTVTVGNDGTVTISNEGTEVATIPPAETVMDKAKTPAEKTEVADKTNLTEEEKSEVKRKVEEANPNFPAGTSVTVGADGTATITYPDGSVDTIPGSELVVEKPAPKQAETITPNVPEKTEVADKTNLTEEEKSEVKRKVEEANPNFPAGTSVTVGADGTATITYPDGSVDTIPGSELVVEKPAPKSTKEKGTTSNKSNSKKVGVLPKTSATTGTDSALPAGLAAALAAMGLLVGRKRRKEEE
ncbi:MAG: LPXTG cell wall anchor domain-containing protein [Gemella sp.]|nr:LPXTG cell wall anchor domain-containing protein [Gemella sp.]